MLLLGGGGAGVFFSGLLGGEDEEAAEAEIEEVEEETPREVVFYDLPEMLVNLNWDAGRESSFLKIQVSLELDSAEAIPEVEAMLPRIVDNFQVYLRELRPEELSIAPRGGPSQGRASSAGQWRCDPIKVYDNSRTGIWPTRPKQ